MRVFHVQKKLIKTKVLATLFMSKQENYCSIMFKYSAEDM